eukprot:gene17841-30952_t
MSKVLVGVTGSVAAIKLPKLVASLQAAGCGEVAVVSTEHAGHFYSKDVPALSQVVWHSDEDEWSTWKKMGDPVLHIELRNWADCFVIAPLDANTLAKLSAGMSDNLLTCVARAWDFSKPILVCPAMNTAMWDHPVTASSLKTLESWGYSQVAPISKTLACGDVGCGAMAEVQTIAAKVAAMLPQPPQPSPPQKSVAAVEAAAKVPSPETELTTELTAPLPKASVGRMNKSSGGGGGNDVARKWPPVASAGTLNGGALGAASSSHGNTATGSSSRYRAASSTTTPSATTTLPKPKPALLTAKPKLASKPQLASKKPLLGLSIKKVMSGFSQPPPPVSNVLPKSKPAAARAGVLNSAPPKPRPAVEAAAAPLISVAPATPAPTFTSKTVPAPAPATSAPQADGATVKTCYLDWIGVLSPHRGKGLGRFISTSCLQHLAARGEDYCTLWTQPSRKAAIKLYESLGFVKLGIHITLSLQLVSP